MSDEAPWVEVQRRFCEVFPPDHLDPLNRAVGRRLVACYKRIAALEAELAAKPSPYHCDASCPNYGPDYKAQRDALLEAAEAMLEANRFDFQPEGMWGECVARLRSAIAQARGQENPTKQQPQGGDNQ